MRAALSETAVIAATECSDPKGSFEFTDEPLSGDERRCCRKNRDDLPRPRGAARHYARAPQNQLAVRGSEQSFCATNLGRSMLRRRISHITLMNATGKSGEPTCLAETFICDRQITGNLDQSYRNPAPITFLLLHGRISGPRRS